MIHILPNEKALEGDIYENSEFAQFGVYHNRRQQLWLPPVPSLVKKMGGDKDTERWAIETHGRIAWMRDYVTSCKPLPHFRWDDLYDYQQQGVRFLLATTRSGQIRALLGDDPRLGKTIQAIVAMDLSTLTYEQPRFLIVCLNSLKLYWADTIREWSCWRHLPIRILEGSKAARLKTIDAVIEGGGFLIVHWEALRQFEKLQVPYWDWIIGDEAHKAKNRKTKTVKALHKLKATHMLFMSATFAEKGPHEYWALLRTLFPKQFTSYYVFEDWFIVQFDAGGFPQYLGPKNKPLFRELMRPILLQRREQDVSVQMPPVTLKQVRVPLTPLQLHWYERIVKEILIELGDGSELEIPNAGARMVRLRQITMSTHFFDLKQESAKINTLVEMATNEIQGPFVVYSTFRDCVDLTVEALTKAGVTAVKAMGGDTSGIQKWQTTNNYRALVCTPQIGGVGLNLAKANELVYLDLPWSSILYKQSSERLRMPGKTDPVQTTFLLGAGTVDERVYTALVRKQLSLNELDLARLILRTLHSKKLQT